MVKRMVFVCLCFLFVLGMASGCKRSAPPAAKSSAYFQTHFQDESQFIVETIVTDLAEQVYFAKFGRLPDPKNFHAWAVEKPYGSGVHKITYNLQIRLDGKLPELTPAITIEDAIWAPELYDGLVKALAQAVSLPAGSGGADENTGLLGKLTDGLATTIEKENQRVSEKLNANFTDGALHEEAAVLLGAFALREHSGHFYDIRLPLCRLTSHLAMARYLNGETPGINGRMALVMLQSLMNNEVAALNSLRDIKTNDAALVAWSRSLRALNTGDYRPLDKVQGLSQIECVQWFYALERAANEDLAWDKLSKRQKQTVDFARIGYASDFSVGMGHELLAVSAPLELAEISSVYQLAHHQKIADQELIPALNELPERCVSTNADNQAQVRVIGWGLWAGFLQRHLCHSVAESFHLMERKWGVPDDAKEFAAKCDKMLDGLRLYPFVRRLNATEVPAYHQAVDDALKVTVATPHLVSADCWDYLYYELRTGECYQPGSPHMDGWFKYNPLPGTAYDPYPRLDMPRLLGRGDIPEALDALRELAPYNWDICYHICETRYQKQPNESQAEELFGKMQAYNSHAMNQLARVMQGRPDKYEELMSRAAEVDPSRYFDLGNYFSMLRKDDKAAEYYEKGNQRDPDSVRASYHASWLIKYYLKKGNVAAARKVADFAGEVYSRVGLVAKAEFFEATGNYREAFEWYAKSEERYDEPGDVIAFCLRYKNKTHGTQFDAELKKRMTRLFPHGIEPAKLADFTAPPVDGVLFSSENGLLREAGLKMGDVIVGVYGIRAHNVQQYEYGRGTSTNSELDLIVWKKQEKVYREIKANPPDHLFDVDIKDYRPNTGS